MAGYSAAKAASSSSLTKHVAVTYGREGIRRNAVAPGVIRLVTASADPERAARPPRRSPCWASLGKAGTPREVGSVIAFLASPAASYVTGQVLAVDGGMTCYLPYAAWGQGTDDIRRRRQGAQAQTGVLA